MTRVTGATPRTEVLTAQESAAAKVCADMHARLLLLLCVFLLKQLLTGNFCPAPEANCNKKCSRTGQYWNGKYTKDANKCDRACVCDKCPTVTLESCKSKCVRNKLKPNGVLIDDVLPSGVTCTKCVCQA